MLKINDLIYWKHKPTQIYKVLSMNGNVANSLQMYNDMVSPWNNSMVYNGEFFKESEIGDIVIILKNKKNHLPQWW